MKTLKTLSVAMLITASVAVSAETTMQPEQTGFYAPTFAPVMTDEQRNAIFEQHKAFAEQQRKSFEEQFKQFEQFPSDPFASVDVDAEFKAVQEAIEAERAQFEAEMNKMMPVDRELPEHIAKHIAESEARRAEMIKEMEARRAEIQKQRDEFRATSMERTPFVLPARQEI